MQNTTINNDTTFQNLNGNIDELIEEKINECKDQPSLKSLMDDPLEDKNVKRICKYFEESSKQDFMDEDDQQSNEILMSYNKNKDKSDKYLASEEKDKENIQFLKPKKWKYLNKINFDEIDKKFRVVKKKINKNEIKNIFNVLNEKTIDSIYDVKQENDSKYKINKIHSLDYMIENYIMTTSSSQKDSIYSNREELKKYVYKYRNISKDNNNFYRCIIFSLFENIVLTNNIMFMKELIIEIDDKINIKNKVIKENDYLKNELELNVQVKIIQQLLYILIKSMSENITKSYELFIKIFLMYEEFDYGMIFILRYLLYEYIDENKYKIYSGENQIELVELLPEKYNKIFVTNEKKFELFFINELFKMKTFADKMIFFLVPFFLDINLRIVLYVSESENPVIQKLFGKEDDNYTLELICFQGLFDVYYNKKYYEFHSKILSNFEEKNEKLFLFKNIKGNDKDNYNINESNNLINDTQEVINSENENNNKIQNENEDGNGDEGQDKVYFTCKTCNKNYNGKENILKLCPQCLNTEFKTDVLKLYNLYLQYVNHNKKYYALQINNYFSSIIKSIKINEITLFDALANTGYFLHDILNQVKKEICVICRNNTNKNFFNELPCNCRLCSKKCFDKYIDIMINKDLEKMNKNSFRKIIFVFEYCICGKKYYYDDILIIYNYFKMRNQIRNCDMIIKIVKNRWKWRCTKCDKYFDPFCMNYRISIFDSKINKDFYDKELTHLLCSECFEHLKLIQKKNVKCIYCKSEHFIMNAKNVTYENKTSDKCDIY